VGVSVTDGEFVVAGSVTVQLRDVNEPPVVETGLEFAVSEHNDGQTDCTVHTYCKPGTVVGRVVALDPDTVVSADGATPPALESFRYTFDPPSSNEEGTSRSSLGDRS